MITLMISMSFLFKYHLAAKAAWDISLIQHLFLNTIFKKKKFSSDVAARGAVFTLRIASDPCSEAGVDDIVSFHRRD